MKEEIQSSINKLKKVFTNNIHDFFFTEKELHSYFLNICFSNKNYIHNGHLLVHAEYPTPFKCSYNDSDIIKLEKDDSKKIRAHIDMVFINPNYIDWINENELEHKFISGIPQSGIFKTFNKELTETYEKFYKETNEAILNYAIEFKFIRHGYLGTKYPVKDIIQDIEKLRLLKNYPKVAHQNRFRFVNNTLSTIFIGERGEYLVKELNADIIKHNYLKSEYIIIRKNA